jgi:hypothetical protein
MAKSNFGNIVPNPHPKTVPVMKLPVSFRHICEVFPELSDMYVGNFIDWAILSPHLKDSVYLAHRLAVRYMNWNSSGRPGSCMTVVTYGGFLNPKTIAKALCPDRPPSVQVIHFAEEEGTQPVRKLTPQHLPMRKVT